MFGYYEIWKRLMSNGYRDVNIESLIERAKELDCIYLVDEILINEDFSFEEILSEVADVLPLGMQDPENCFARIIFDDKVYCKHHFKPTEWYIKSAIKVQKEIFGLVEVYFIEQNIKERDSKFLDEEKKLLTAIADRISLYIIHQKFSDVFREWRNKQADQSEKKPDWRVIMDMLKRTDQHTFSIISRKMINHLFYKGIKEAKELFKKLGNLYDDDNPGTEVNRPTKKQVLDNSFNLGDEVFSIAAHYLTEDEILNNIQKWINEEKTHFLVKSLANLSTPLIEIADSIRRYYLISPNLGDRRSANSEGIRVSLVRRFLTDQLDFINIAKSYCDVSDFYDLLQNMIFPPESHGKVGGKSAGLFLAKKIIQKSPQYKDILADVKTPRTWYITSDAIINFIYYNNLEEVVEQRYKEIDQIRQEYPHIMQAFKNSHFPTELINGLSRALDDFGRSPIIVRSSSLLEDRMGSAFAGKYKSLFLANQGTKKQRLDALMDAISEVYASTFSPDPIGYRKERGLIDFHEEMGIMIQQVVGLQIGKYFLPPFAGVAFSNNEFRWSPRIKREDGLIRMVPGLGTRAVDRISDEYPILIAPGNPEMRVNLSLNERIAYSPKNIDVINLENNSFETIPIRKVIDEAGDNYPLLNEIFSIQEDSNLKTPVGLGINTKKDKDLIVTFENLIKKSGYIKQIDEILKILKEKFEVPVDIEFASDGRDLYLLQCRPQSSNSENVSAIIPKDISPEKILFNAKKYVSNGRVPEIKYIVYIDPDSYSQIQDFQDLKAVGKVVGMLNKMLPKKSFILMGPGRWGSRDDIRLGVSVTYSDINNTSVLIEIAKKKGSYVPELSFGTHFFQDLVEASIRYLPLYPDDDGIIFNSRFLLESENTLNRYLPEYSHLSNTIRVINVHEATKGQILRILMNADEEEALAILTESTSKPAFQVIPNQKEGTSFEEPWEWRTRWAETLASYLDPIRFGIAAVYLFGTTFHKTAVHNSDVDLLVHFSGDDIQKEMLSLWFEGWNDALREVNFFRTGYMVDNLIDVYYVTDEDLLSKKYYAQLIEQNSNFAKRLKLKGE